MAMKHLIGFAAAGLAFCAPALAEDGVTPNRVLFGQTAALDGPAAALGTGMRDGLLAAFTEANRAGGVKGHKLQLLSRSDGYEPDRATAVARELITKDHVFALIGSVGTPTSVAVQPIADESGVPFIGAFTGAEFLRRPYKHDVVNVRASYFQETEAIVDHLLRDRGLNRIAIFYQNDAFGQAGVAGVMRALGKRNLDPAAQGSYERNTVDVKDAFDTIRAANPQAVLMIGTYKPCAAFIRLARAAKITPQFVAISFVGADALQRELGADGAGVVVSEVVPFPEDASIPVVARYQAALRALGASERPNYVSLEGYVVGRLVVDALKGIQGPITRAGLLDAVSTIGHFDLGGLELNYSGTDNRGSNAVFFARFEADGSMRQVSSLAQQ